MSSIVSPFGHKSVQALSDFTIADRLRYSLSLAALLVTLWTQPFLSFFFFAMVWTVDILAGPKKRLLP